MKKSMLIVLALLLVLVITGCARQRQETPSAGQPATEPADEDVQTVEDTTETLVDTQDTVEIGSMI
ncbi:MAG TPA: hypothetical protein VJI75_05420 [Candidatus Nanoarchaeia archaeon]|nr:hypothetical protein [Candidatus Nanoarchaeia archaeon]